MEKSSPVIIIIHQVEHHQDHGDPFGSQVDERGFTNAMTWLSKVGTIEIVSSSSDFTEAADGFHQ